MGGVPAGLPPALSAPPSTGLDTKIVGLKVSLLSSDIFWKFRMMF